MAVQRAEWMVASLAEQKAGTKAVCSAGPMAVYLVDSKAVLKVASSVVHSAA